MNVHEANTRKCIVCAVPQPVGGIVPMQAAIRDEDGLWEVVQVGESVGSSGMVWSGDELADELTMNAAPVREDEVVVFSPDDDAELLLQHAGEAWARAVNAERIAAATVHALIRSAVAAGVSERRAAIIAGVDRMTVRRALGKL